LKIFSRELWVLLMLPKPNRAWVPSPSAAEARAAPAPAPSVPVSTPSCRGSTPPCPSPLRAAAGDRHQAAPAAADEARAGAGSISCNTSRHCHQVARGSARYGDPPPLLPWIDPPPSPHLDRSVLGRLLLHRCVMNVQSL